MKPAPRLKYDFVEFIPEHPEQSTLYISIAYATAIHKCCCGCGYEVATPLSPTDWALTFDGETVSLHPSIGNWSFPCRSHYWIRRNQVIWAEPWSQSQIEAGRRHDVTTKERRLEVDPVHEGAPEAVSSPSEGFLMKIWKWLRRL